MKCVTCGVRMKSEVAVTISGGVRVFACMDCRVAGAYSPDGLYIGEPSFAARLVDRYGITQFFGKREGSTVASVGFSSKHGKWYGWSHRGMCGFAIGDALFEAQFGDERTRFTEHGRRRIKTMSEAKLAARRFAEYID